MTIHEIPDGVRPVGLARYLSRAWPCLPSHVLREALKRRNVRVNGVRSGADAVVKGGDRLTLYIDERFLGGAVRLIYQDEQLLVAEKPAGLPVDVDAGEIGADTLLSRLRAVHPAARLCHRLDVGTGGALILALSEAAHEAVLAAFKAHRVDKRYQTVVAGCPQPEEARLSAFLTKDAGDARVRVSSSRAPGALAIETRYRVIESGLKVSDALALVEIELVTGRTHQIRAHMAHIGHPVLGDDKYGDRALNKKYRVKTPQLWCTRLAIEAGGVLERYRGMAFRSEPRFQVQ